MVSTRQFEKAILGVLAGVVATAAMTATMRRLHAFLPADESIRCRRVRSSTPFL